MSNEAWRRLRAVGENVVLYPFAKGSRDWQPQELAEFYRVENVLIQNGMRVVTDRGLTDEGDPWFVFCRESDGETIVHFARIDGQYLIVSPAYEGVARGNEFRAMIREMIERHKLSLASDEKGKANVHLHPAVLLVVLIGAAFFKTPSSAQADELKKDAANWVRSEAGPLNGAVRTLPTGERGFSFLPDTQSSHNDQLTLRNLWLIASAAALGGVDEADAAEASAIPFRENNVGAFVDADSGVSADKLSVYLRLEEGVSPIEAEAAPLAASALIGSDGTQQVWRASMMTFDDVKMAEAHPLETVVGTRLPIPITFFDQTSVFAAAIPVKTFVVGGSQPGYLYDATVQASGKASEKSPAQPFQALGHDGPLGDVATSHFKNTVVLSISGDQVGSAITFLNENKIFELLKSESPEDLQNILSFQISLSSEGGDNGNPSLSDATPSQREGEAIITSNQFLGSETFSSVDFVKALSSFLQEGENVNLTVSDGVFVFYEQSAILSENKITATFADGSAISIIGQPELLQSIVFDLM